MSLTPLCILGWHSTVWCPFPHVDVAFLVSVYGSLYGDYYMAPDQTKAGRYFQLHGSMWNPCNVLDILGSGETSNAPLSWSVSSRGWIGNRNSIPASKVRGGLGRPVTYTVHNTTPHPASSFYSIDSWYRVARRVRKRYLFREIHFVYSNNSAWNATI